MTKVIEKYDRHSIRRRASLRGIKKCPSCGCVNGQRALICCNSKCILRQQQLATLKPLDPIQLITYNDNGHTNNNKWFSVRCKEKLTNLRSFVYIPSKEDHQQQQKQSNEIITTTKTFCYVNSCKYDFYDAMQISCKHIRACQSTRSSSSNSTSSNSKNNETPTFQQAKPFKLDKNILWNLNLTEERKQFLCNLYQSDESYMPAVQCLNGCIFVVKCLMTETFPAGRLHLTIYPDVIARRKGTFSCSCKNRKLPSKMTKNTNKNNKNHNNNNTSTNSQIMCQPYDIYCDHVLLVMAAILSQSDEKYRYNEFLNNLQAIWMPSPDVNGTLSPLNKSVQTISTYDVCNDEIDGNITRCTTGEKSSSLAASISSMQNHFTDDLFNFCDELFSDCMLSDFIDIDLEMQNGLDNSLSHNNIDLNMESKSNVNDNVTVNHINNNGVQLNASLQWQQRRQHNQQSQQINSCQKRRVQLQMKGHYGKCNGSQNVPHGNQLITGQDVNHCQNNNQILVDKSNRQQQQSLLKPLTIKTANRLQQQQQQEQQIYIVTATATSCNAAAQNSFQVQPLEMLNIIEAEEEEEEDQRLEQPCPQQQQSPKTFHIENDDYKSVTTTPTITFESWLNHIIEVLNESIDIKDNAHVKHIFHVHEDTFSYFSKTFGLNKKRRLPNVTAIVKSGLYKDLIKYSWHFTQSAIVQRIFNTKQMKFEMERLFYLNDDGSFRRYMPNLLLNIKMKESPIYPKIKLYTAFVNFNCNNANRQCSNFDQILNNSELPKLGVTIDWLPMSFPKSNYGIMTIEFYVGVKENHLENVK